LPYEGGDQVNFSIEPLSTHLSHWKRNKKIIRFGFEAQNWIWRHEEAFLYFDKKAHCFTTKPTFSDHDDEDNFSDGDFYEQSNQNFCLKNAFPIEATQDFNDDEYEDVIFFQPYDLS